MQETRVQFQGQEDPLAKEMANHSTILVWRIPWIEEPGGLQSWGCKESDTTERLTVTVLYLVQYFGDGNGTPFQSSCLENPMGGGAW